MGFVGLANAQSPVDEFAPFLFRRQCGGDPDLMAKLDQREAPIVHALDAYLRGGFVPFVIPAHKQVFETIRV